MSTAVDGPGGRAFYRILRAIVLPIARVVFRIRFEGLEHVPKGGPFVLAPTHRSLLDVPFAGFVSRRRVRFMTKKELFERRFPAWFFTSLGGFPVDRHATDRAALRASEAILDRGEPLALFPEGTRNAGPTLGPLKDGAAFLAARARVPIVPVGIAGSEEILPSGARRPRLRRVTIVVGAPLAAPPHEGRVPRREVRALTEVLGAELQRAFDEAQRRAV